MYLRYVCDKTKKLIVGKYKNIISYFCISSQIRYGLSRLAIFLLQ